MEKSSSSISKSIWFLFHSIVVLLSWLGPFLFSWFILVPVYLLVILQFIIFKRCLVNEKHGLKDEDDITFYSNLFESMHFRPNRKKLKLFIRRYLYILLSLFTILLQLVLHFKPLLF